jgi:hypothetical protein
MGKSFEKKMNDKIMGANAPETKRTVIDQILEKISVLEKEIAEIKSRTLPTAPCCPYKGQTYPTYPNYPPYYPNITFTC